MNYTKDELAVIFTDSFDFLDYKNKEVIISTYLKTGSIALALDDENVKKLILEEKLDKIKVCTEKSYIDNILSVMDKAGVVAVTELSDDYPERLRSVYAPPHVLYAKGNLELLKNKRPIAIVGSRKSIPLSRAIGKNYAKVLSEAGMAIVTGIAEGVEEDLIEAALSTGNIISVTAGGLDMVYPKQNLKLFERVAESGLCLSEQRLGFKPMPYHYPVRNRIIAGLADGVLVVSAGLKSGTMHTVGYALDGGKDVFVIPYNIGVQSGEGCNKLIKSGAYLTDEPKDIADFYGVSLKDEEILELSEAERKIYEAVKEAGSIHIEKLCEKISLQAFEILPLLSMLELNGLIIKNAGNFYSCIIN